MTKRMIPVYRSLAEIPADLGPHVAAIGNFDGVHLGHREILSGAVEDARERGVRALVITFDPHPEQFLRPEVAPKMLTPIPERLRL
jgi:riboflavin kinase/FMN adenylyltransferase